MFSSDYDIVHTKTLEDIMEENHHSHIDLLKLDIEGAEVRVLKNMLDSKIYPKYLCIEFDLMLKGIDHGNETVSIIDKLKNCGYIELKNDDLNITYIYQGWRIILAFLSLLLKDIFFDFQGFGFISNRKYKPFMKNRETILIEELLKNMQPKNCLEWGSGFSTFNFSRLIPSS